MAPVPGRGRDPLGSTGGPPGPALQKGWGDRRPRPRIPIPGSRRRCGDRAPEHRPPEAPVPPTLSAPQGASVRRVCVLPWHHPSRARPSRGIEAPRPSLGGPVRAARARSPPTAGAGVATPGTLPSPRHPSRARASAPRGPRPLPRVPPRDRGPEFPPDLAADPCWISVSGDPKESGSCLRRSTTTAPHVRREAVVPASDRRMTSGLGRASPISPNAGGSRDACARGCLTSLNPRLSAARVPTAPPMQHPLQHPDDALRMPEPARKPLPGRDPRA